MHWLNYKNRFEQKAKSPCYKLGLFNLVIHLADALKRRFDTLGKYFKKMLELIL